MVEPEVESEDDEFTGVDLAVSDEDSDESEVSSLVDDREADESSSPSPPPRKMLKPSASAPSPVNSLPSVTPPAPLAPASARNEPRRDQFPRPVPPIVASATGESSQAVVARRTYVRQEPSVEAEDAPGAGSSSARTASSAPQLTRKLGVNGKTLVTAVNQDEQLRDLEGLFQSDDGMDLPSDVEIDSITSLGNLLFVIT